MQCPLGSECDDDGTCVTSSSEFVERAGQCPLAIDVQAPPAYRLCDVACVTDNSCPAEQKCCYNGCGYGCAQPIPDDSSTSWDTSEESDRTTTPSSSTQPLDVDSDELSYYLSICSMPVDVGLRECNEPAERFYYDISDGVCKPFEYRGCGGNENYFWTHDECEHFCSRC